MSVNAKLQTEKRSSLPVSARIGWTITWMILWVFIMGGVALIILGFGAWVLSPLIQSGVMQMTGTNLRSTILVFTLAMALVSTAILSLTRKSKDVSGRQARNVLKIYTVLGVFIGGLIITQTTDPIGSLGHADAGINTQVTTHQEVDIKQNKKMLAALKALNARYTDKLNLTYVKKYKDKNHTDKAGEYQASVDELSGAFLYADLTIKTGLPVDQEKITLAHEYLHHVWFAIMKDDIKEKLTSDLIAMYGNDPQMSVRVKEYISSRSLQPTELFSYYCTESSDAYLTKYVLVQCNKYIKRGALSLRR